MPAEDDDVRFDPRFDPRFQRGYRAADGLAHDSGERLAGAQAAAIPPPMPHELGTTARTAAADSAGGSPADGGNDEYEAEDDEYAAYRLRSRLRRSLITLWCSGVGLTLLGVVCLCVGIQVNQRMSTGVEGDSPLIVANEITSALMVPALFVGLATIVGSVVVQVATSGRGGRA